jgi:hypothetical protein
MSDVPYSFLVATRVPKKPMLLAAFARLAILTLRIPAIIASPQRSGGGVMQEPSDPRPGEGSPHVQAIPLSGLSAPQQALPNLSPEEISGLCVVPAHLVRTDNDGRRLVLVVQASPELVKGVQIMETTGEVEVTVYRTPPPPGLTPAISVHSTVLVKLGDPLGTRWLIGPASTS